MALLGDQLHFWLLSALMSSPGWNPINSPLQVQVLVWTQTLACWFTPTYCMFLPHPWETITEVNTENNNNFPKIKCGFIVTVGTRQNSKGFEIRSICAYSSGIPTLWDDAAAGISVHQLVPCSYLPKGAPFDPGRVLPSSHTWHPWFC